MSDFEISITSLKYQYATHILNNQDKFNKDYNSTLNSSELQLVMKEFGKNDLSELLKGNNDKIEGSIFEEGKNGEKLINIMRFKDDIAKAILENQDKLNFEKLNSQYDAYISETELQEILKNFGVGDVSQLLKQEETPNTSESANDEKNEETSQDIENSEDDTNSNTEESISELKQDSKSAFDNRGSAANEILNSIMTDLSLVSADSPQADQMERFQQLKSKRNAANENTSLLDEQSETLRMLVEDTLRENPEQTNVNTITKTISYGKDNSKKALLSQSFGLNGNNASKMETTDNTEQKKEEADGSESSDTTETTEEEKKNYRRRNFIQH